MKTAARTPAVAPAPQNAGAAPTANVPDQMSDDARRTGETVRIGEVNVRRLMVLSHHIEVLATRIGADCERILRAVHQPDRAAWRSAVGEALLASRQVATVAQSVRASDEDAAVRELAALEEAVRRGLQQVVESMTPIARAVPVTLADELLVGDVRAIRATAAEVLAPDALPRLATSETPGDKTGSGATSDVMSGDMGANGRILVADDSDEIRRVLERLLTRLGHTVLQARDGREALEIAHSQSVDLVLTDLNMPEMRGMELLRAIKASPMLARLPVIVVSGEKEVADVVECIENGADDHIPKPFQPTLLQARVRSSLVSKRLRDVERDHLRRAGEIAEAADAVDRNAYVPGALAHVAAGGDNLANLARVFERMVLNLQSREDRLNERLHRLRAELGTVSATGVTIASPSSESSIATGTLLGGRYAILGLLGRGGMGVVYHAADRELHEEVAIKVVREDLVMQDPTLVERLKSEIRLARRLSHPNILRAHDLGEAGGAYFISMEYVRGVSLLELLDQRGRVSVPSAIAIGIQLADALGAAHAQQIIHRDIKPANLLMDERGVLKVMDFGLAKVVAGEAGQTQRGMAVGTPKYMAPEQLMGGTLDARSDLFAVGVVLYECLSGRVPFDVTSPITLVSRMIDGDYPPLTRLVPDAPPRLEQLIARLLLLEPEARIQTAAELSRMLSHLEVAAAEPV